MSIGYIKLRLTTLEKRKKGGGDLMQFYKIINGNIHDVLPMPVDNEERDICDFLLAQNGFYSLKSNGLDHVLILAKKNIRF